MKRLRFLLFAVGMSTSLFALPAAGQEARVEDIQISHDAGGSGAVSILVKLSQQPRSASAVPNGAGLVIEIDGVALPALAFDPAGQTLVRHVTVAPASRDRK